VCAEAVVPIGGEHGDILDVGAEGAIGEGTGETDEGGAIPGGDGRAGGEGLGDGGGRAVGPPAEESVQAAHGGRRDGARVVRENVEHVHSSRLPPIARAAGQGRRSDAGAGAPGRSSVSLWAKGGERGAGPGPGPPAPCATGARARGLAAAATPAAAAVRARDGLAGGGSWGLDLLTDM